LEKYGWTTGKDGKNAHSERSSSLVARECRNEQLIRFPDNSIDTVALAIHPYSVAIHGGYTIGCVVS
jgi:hypothetical protein